MVEVIVPATSANLGPGFDVFGIALNLYNSFTVEEAESILKIEVLEGLNDKSRIPTDERNLVYRSAKRLFDEVGHRFKGLKISIKSGVPFGRGLGSSSTAVVGGLLAANELSGARLSKREIFLLATEIEGHPDNVGPAIFGGFTVCYPTGGRYGIVSHKPSLELKPVLLIPDSVLETKKARAVLPPRIPMGDAVFNISRASLLVTALLTGEAGLLKSAMEDKLHQPYRAALIPGLLDVLQAVGKIDQAGVALSGAGPSLICLIKRSGEAEFLEEAGKILKDMGGGYKMHSAEFDLAGARAAV